MSVRLAYGLAVHSPVELWPQSSHPASTCPTVMVSASRLASRREGNSTVYFPGRASAQVDLAGMGLVRAKRGQQLDVELEPWLALDRAAPLITAIGLPLILDQRGFLVLHGSCVEVDGIAAAFLGPSGSGKSTLARAMTKRGHRLISDGLTAALSQDGLLWAVPGPPQRRLWSDAAAHFDDPGSGAGGEQETLCKRTVPVAEPMATGLCPLRIAFVTEPSSLPQARMLRPMDQIMGLAHNFYLNDYLTLAGAPQVLHLCANAARTMSVLSLLRGRELSQIPRACELVERAVADL